MRTLEIPSHGQKSLLNCQLVFKNRYFRRRWLIAALISITSFHYVLNVALLLADTDSPSSSKLSIWEIDEAEASVLFASAPGPITIHEAGKKRIGIITVVDASTTRGALKYAMTTVACYARIQSYEYRVVNESFYYDKCTQTKPEFRRHCIIRLLLPNYDYILFLDANIGVVNPRRRIEEFIDEYADIVFYDRFQMSELMSGSYLVRNSEWSCNFLDQWANYEQRLPQSFYSSDSAALYGTAWARDSFVTDGMWSLRRDFMLFDVEQKRRWNTRTMENIVSSGSTYSWYSKFVGGIQLSRCYPGNTTWKYDRAFFAKDIELEARYRRLRQEMHYEKLSALGRVPDFFEGTLKKPEKYVFRDSGWAT